MKRFEFHLAKVRDYRRQRLEMEEAKLQPIFAQRQALESESARLDREAVETRKSLLTTVSAQSQDLAAMDLYLRHLGVTKKKHSVKVEDCRIKLGEQQKMIVEARRAVRLMEILEERQHREWRTSVDREQENLSSELYVARWKRN